MARQLHSGNGVAQQGGHDEKEPHLHAIRKIAVYKPGDGVSTPRLIKSVSAQYSAGAMRRKVNGSVSLRCVVDRDGLPTRLEVIKPLDEDLDRAALDALEQWRFAPGEKDGKAVLVQIDVMFAFSTKQ